MFIFIIFVLAIKPVLLIITKLLLILFHLYYLLFMVNAFLLIMVAQVC